MLNVHEAILLSINVNTEAIATRKPLLSKPFKSFDTGIVEILGDFWYWDRIKLSYRKYTFICNSKNI